MLDLRMNSLEYYFLKLLRYLTAGFESGRNPTKKREEKKGKKFKGTTRTR